MTAPLRVVDRAADTAAHSHYSALAGKPAGLAVRTAAARPTRTPASERLRKPEFQ